MAATTLTLTGAGRYERPSTPGPSPATVGLLLLRQADRRLGLTEALAQALPDWREKRRVEHSDLELIRQRIYGICAGYEDCNDAKTMRRDPALKAACDRDPDQGADLASQPTLSRFENEVGPKSCYLLAEKLFESYLQRHKQRPSRLILDLDTTDDTAARPAGASLFQRLLRRVRLPTAVDLRSGRRPDRLRAPTGQVPRDTSGGGRPQSASSTGYAKSGRECPFLSGVIAASRPRSCTGYVRTTRSTSLSASAPTSGSSAWPQNSPSRRAVVSCARGTRPACSRLSDIAPWERVAKRWPRSYRMIIKAESHRARLERSLRGDQSCW